VAGGGEDNARPRLPRHPQKRQGLGNGLDESAIWQIVRHYAAQVGHENFAPHDARRSCARIYYDAKAPLKQIKFLLGHDKLDTTARYVNDEQKFGGRRSAK
jgi:integrase